jgi:dTDP-glucose 4,6-dehydratase
MDSKTKAAVLVREDVEAVLEGRTGLLKSLAGGHLFITGGTGFLGSWLLELLAFLNKKHGFKARVTIYSRTPKLFVERLPHLGQDPAFKFIEGDVCHLVELPADVTHLIHAAALTDRNHFASNPTRVGEVNANATLRVLRAAQLLPDLQRFVLLSSGLTYGETPLTVDRVDESYAGGLRPFDFNAIYAESKRFGEALAAAFLSETKLPVVVARPFAFVGPYQSLELPWAVTDFIRDALAGGPIKIMGDGSTVRSLMYASDFAFWILAIAAQGRLRSAYNVGSSEPIDLLSLARQITNFFNPIPEIETELGGAGHPSSRLVPSTDKAQRELGVTMTVPLKQALQRAITWQKFSSQPDEAAG